MSVGLGQDCKEIINIIDCRRKCCPPVPPTARNTDTINLIPFQVRPINNIDYYTVAQFDWIPALYVGMNTQLIYDAFLGLQGAINGMELQLFNETLGVPILTFQITQTETKIVNIMLPIAYAKIAVRLRALNNVMTFGRIRTLQLFISSA